MPTLQDKPTAPDAAATVAPAPVAQPTAPDATSPGAGGCYVFDPATGVTTLVTPSTIQE